MKIIGKNFIGYTLSDQQHQTFKSQFPATETESEERFHIASLDEVDQTMERATQAGKIYAQFSGAQRADFLMAITEEILALGDILIERAHLESGLSHARLVGERQRTIKQLTQFADLVRDGTWVNARIDTAQSQPSPTPDLRKKLIPIGPVVVFGSSNFPFAFSVAGVDAGPALAAGNSVIIKAHAAHPGVSDLTAQAVVKAAQRTGIPDGVFSMLYDSGFEVGAALVKHPQTKAVGFTGSIKGGMALYQMAQSRPDPIPVFAEMGSVNPIVILPRYLKKDPQALAQKLTVSVTADAGQFCTDPGLIFVTKSPGFEEFEEALKTAFKQVAPTTMLTSGMCKNYYKLCTEILQTEAVEVLAVSEKTSALKNQSQATIAKVKAVDFIQNAHLQEEIFGPFTLLVVCEDTTELHAAISTLTGQLTASILADVSEISAHPEILNQLQSIAGRIIFDGVPTGVTVCPSMQHGGPFPSSTDSRFTSVGRDSILRFVRPQSYQNWPDELLPAELQNKNPLGILRLVNNQWTQDTIPE
jgi:alpha-ketoglutaric semialdehyde dehydrogenase